MGYPRAVQQQLVRIIIRVEVLHRLRWSIAHPDSVKQYVKGLEWTIAKALGNSKVRRRLWRR